jgi:hypothetical protein
MRCCATPPLIANGDIVPAYIIRVGDMKGLMQIAYPMANRHESDNPTLLTL